MQDLPLTTAVIKACLHKDPPTARYQQPFDLDKLLRYLETWPPNQRLSLEKLRTKVIILLRICALTRSRDLTRIDRTSIVFGPRLAWMKFNILGTKGDLRHIHPKHIKAYAQKPNLCPVRATKLLLTQTAQHSGNALFYSLRSPFKPIGPERMAKLALDFMLAAGIDTGHKSHGIRATTASALLKAGALVDEVMKLGIWKDYRTFMVFYNLNQADLDVADMLFS
jgi:integrase-like protein